MSRRCGGKTPSRRAQTDPHARSTRRPAARAAYVVVGGGYRHAVAAIAEVPPSSYVGADEVALHQVGSRLDFDAMEAVAGDDISSRRRRASNGVARSHDLHAVKVAE